MISRTYDEFQPSPSMATSSPSTMFFQRILLTPVSGYLRISPRVRVYSCLLLESVRAGEKIARYTFAGAHPEKVSATPTWRASCQIERLEWVREERDPISFLARAQIERFRPVRLPGLPPLVARHRLLPYYMVRCRAASQRLRDESRPVPTPADVSSRALRVRSRAATACDRSHFFTPKARHPLARIQRRLAPQIK